MQVEIYMVKFNIYIVVMSVCLFVPTNLSLADSCYIVQKVTKFF